MSASPIRLPNSLKDKDTFGFFEDWVDNFVTGDRWTPLTTDSSATSSNVLVLKTTGGRKGILSVTQDATDNDEIYFGTTVSSFLFAANKPCYTETLMQYTEGNTDDNNVIYGFLDSYGANTLIDNGVGPVASATMAVIYKVDGGTVWRCRSQIGAAVGITDTISTTTAGGSAYQKLSVEVNPYSATNAKVIYKCDGQPLRDSNNIPIVHDLVYTNAVVCSVVWGVKNGSGTAEVTLNDYICGYQTR